MKRRSGTIYLLCLAAINTIAAAVGCSSTNHDAASPGASGAAGADAGHLAPTTLYLVGDSTVCGFNDAYYYPRYGYGTQIGKYLDSSVTVNNLALSGRSSKSFIDPLDNPNYAALTSSIKAGDYLIIGFGHNDEKADNSLYTNPNADSTDPTSFEYYLYKYYVQVAQAAGATPILATPIVRRDAAGAYTGAKAHVTADVISGGVTYPGGDYAQAVRDLGAEFGVTVIDNTASTIALGKQIFADSGADGTAKLQAWVSDAPTSVDDTHTNIYGAAYYAYLIASDLAASDSTLKSYVLPGIMPPDISTLVPNPNWTPSPYMPPIKGTQWMTTDPWIGSVFGDVGGASKISDGSFSITETAPSPLTVAMRSGTATTAAGKIASGTDGIAFDFQQVPIDKDFTLSATATVTSITYNNSQVGFGLMVRDAAWVDTFDPSLISSYVAAGSLKGNSPAAAWSSFIRDMSGSPQLTGTTVSSPTVVPAAGSVIDLRIVKTGDIYTCTYGTEDPAVYTIDLNTKDDAFVYAGLFTARECEVAFSNVDLTITN
jgi:lysophospholipase L1-like esterase